MSVSDPLLRSLKKAIIDLCFDTSVEPAVVKKTDICDDNVALQQLCEIIEEIFRKGLYRTGGIFNMEHRDYWHWLQDLPRLVRQVQAGGRPMAIHPRYDDCLNVVNRYTEKVETAQGRGRLMLRALLSYRILHWPLECLCMSLGKVSQYYSDFNALLGNEILTQMLVSQLSQLSVVGFKLNLANAMFLDESWVIPDYRTYEFVPCKQLGVSLVTIDAYQVVESIKMGSVAEEDKYLQCGDVLDELYHLHLKWCKIPLKDVMRANENKPVRLSVVKLKLKDGTMFPPIVRILRKAGMLSIIGKSESSPSDTIFSFNGKFNNDFPDDIPSSNPQMSPYYGLRYVGSSYVGAYGGVSKIEGSIAETLKHYNDPSSYIPVYIELGEKDLIIRKATIKKASDDSENSQKNDPSYSGNLPILFAHAYPQISSCGRRIDCCRFLAYIVGESTCTISKHFVCHVFEARSEVESKSVLCNIAQGFERTHWTI